MESGDGQFRGGRPMVNIQRRVPNPLEQRLRALLLGRTVVSVNLAGDQLTLNLDDGSSFTMNCTGGFNEVA